MKWKHFPRHWPFVRGSHRSPHKGQWRGPVMFCLICARIHGWVNNRKAGDLGRHLAHYDVIVMCHLVNTIKTKGKPCTIFTHSHGYRIAKCINLHTGAEQGYTERHLITRHCHIKLLHCCCDEHWRMVLKGCDRKWLLYGTSKYVCDINVANTTVHFYL